MQARHQTWGLSVAAGSSLQVHWTPGFCDAIATAISHWGAERAGKHVKLAHWEMFSALPVNSKMSAGQGHQRDCVRHFGCTQDLKLWTKRDLCTGSWLLGDVFWWQRKCIPTCFARTTLTWCRPWTFHAQTIAHPIVNAAPCAQKKEGSAESASEN